MQTPTNREDIRSLSEDALKVLKNKNASEKRRNTIERNKMFEKNHLFLFDAPPKQAKKVQKPKEKSKPMATAFDFGSLQIEIDYDFDPRDEEAHIPEIRYAGGREYNPSKDLPPSSSYNWKGYEEKLHEILLVRSIHTLMDNRCSQTIRQEITQWLNAPLIPEEQLQSLKALKLLPFSFQACCIFAEVNPIELIENLSFSLRINNFPYEFDLIS